MNAPVTLWIETDAGLDKLNLSKPLFKSYKLDIKNGEKVKESSEIFKLISGQTGKILINSTNWYVFDRKSESIMPYPLSPKIHFIYHDKADNLWCCEGIGV